jgi:hypothetical protein
MPKARANIFGEGEGEELDVGSFAPKASIDAKAPGAEQVRAVAQAAKFQSREPAAPKTEVPAKRAVRQYRTGRNVQFNVKVRQETVDAFYAVADSQSWVLGYTVQRAIEALQRELKNPHE